MSTPSYRSEWEELNSLRLRQGLIITPRRGGKDTITDLKALLEEMRLERDALRISVDLGREEKDKLTEKLADEFRKGAIEGWDSAVRSMVYQDGSPVEVVTNVNPYREDDK